LIVFSKISKKDPVPEKCEIREIREIREKCENLPKSAKMWNSWNSWKFVKFRQKKCPKPSLSKAD
jgi:hypothetical protein